MITIRKSSERGQANHGWLLSYHSFSFADYYDSQQMGWGSLRVINEDRVQPGRGFGAHEHHDMEIISYVLEGQLQHSDSMGNGAIIIPGDVQRISAGTGIQHSEFNPSSTSPVHFIQIWITPERTGIKPGYEQKSFPVADRRGQLRLVASRHGRSGSITIHQDADVYVSLLSPGEKVSHPVAAGRIAYLHLIKGAARVNETRLASGDAAKIRDEAELAILAEEESELLLFDLAS